MMSTAETVSIAAADQPKQAEQHALAERAFFDRLEDQLGRGEWAALRRCAGLTIAESQRRVPWFFRHLTSKDRGWNEELYFLCACLYAVARRADRPPLAAAGSFGASMWRLRSAVPNGESVERRFWVLLDASFGRESGLPGGGELAFRLKSLTMLLNTRKYSIGVDWPALLSDLKRWESEKKPVQKRWARDFYPAPAGPAERS